MLVDKQDCVTTKSCGIRKKIIIVHVGAMLIIGIHELNIADARIANRTEQWPLHGPRTCPFWPIRGFVVPGLRQPCMVIVW